MGSDSGEEELCVDAYTCLLTWRSKRSRLYLRWSAIAFLPSSLDVGPIFLLVYSIPTTVMFS